MSTTESQTSEMSPATGIERRPGGGEIHGPPPWKEGQEWANALTHGFGAAMTLVLGAQMISVAATKGTGLTIACLAYLASVFGTFLCSALSHVFRDEQTLNTMRAWDQAMIYAMISGTYTPIIYRYASDSTQASLLLLIWLAAGMGFLFKVALRHRINSTGMISYLMLGWFPTVPLIGQVPLGLAWWMFAGGVIYSLGVVVLVNDSKMKYLHALWHISVMTAALVHYVGIFRYVVTA